MSISLLLLVKCNGRVFNHPRCEKCLYNSIGISQIHIPTAPPVADVGCSGAINSCMIVKVWAVVALCSRSNTCSHRAPIVVDTFDANLVTQWHTSRKRRVLKGICSCRLDGGARSLCQPSLRGNSHTGGRQAGVKLDAIATVVHEGDCTDRLISKCRNCDVYG